MVILFYIIILLFPVDLVIRDLSTFSVASIVRSVINIVASIIVTFLMKDLLKYDFLRIKKFIENKKVSVLEDLNHKD